MPPRRSCARRESRPAISPARRRAQLDSAQNKSARGVQERRSRASETLTHHREVEGRSAAEHAGKNGDASEPEICWIKLNIEEAMPALAVGTALMAAVMTGVTSSPSPTLGSGSGKARPTYSWSCRVCGMST